MVVYEPKKFIVVRKTSITHHNEDIFFGFVRQHFSKKKNQKERFFKKLDSEKYPRHLFNFNEKIFNAHDNFLRI